MRLADYLSSENVSPKDFAMKIGVTAEAIRLYTKGARVPRPKVMEAIQRATDGRVSANDFFEVRA